MSAEFEKLHLEALQMIQLNQPKAAALIETMLRLSKATSNGLFMMKTELLKGLWLAKQGAISEAHELMESVLEGARNKQHFNLELQTLKALGDLHFDIDDYNGALDYYFSCLSLDTGVLHEIEDKGLILVKIGQVYDNFEQFDIAMGYYSQALEHSVKSEQNHRTRYMFHQIAESLLLAGEYDEAFKTINKYFDATLQEGDLDSLGNAYLQYAKYYGLIGNSDEASRFYEKSIKKLENNVDLQSLCIAMCEYGTFLYNNSHYEQAHDILLEATMLGIEQSKCSKSLTIHYYLAKCYEALSDYEKAYLYFKRYHEIKSLKDETWKTIKLRNIVNKYEYIRSDIRVQELENTNENLTIISKIGRDITSSIDFDEVLKKISVQVEQLFTSSTFLVGYLSNSKKMAITHFNEGEISHQTIYNDLENDYLFHLTKKAELKPYFNGKQLDKQGFTSSSDTVDCIKSFVSCPLMYHEKSVGLVMIYSDQTERFEESGQEVLRILASYISVAIKNSKQSVQLLETNRKLKDLTEKDGLTKVYNRYALNKNIKKILKKGYTFNNPVGMVMIDVDFFKEFNDNYGHLAGDKCLIKVSKVLSKIHLKAMDRPDYGVFRYGGDEFLMIIYNMEQEALINLCESLRVGVQDLKIKHQYSKRSDYVSLTIGLCVVNVRTDDYETLFTVADQALYQAKKAGRNNVKYIEYN